eukprot:9344137-Pyramimonas_sp.AAC.1
MINIRDAAAAVVRRIWKFGVGKPRSFCRCKNNNVTRAWEKGSTHMNGVPRRNTPTLVFNVSLVSPVHQRCLTSCP